MTAPKTSPPEAAWALALFNRSVLKQAKVRQIIAKLDDPAGKRALDIGAYLKPRSLLNRFGHAIGLTDEWDGHLRPGYSLEGLRQLLGPAFIIEGSTTYSGAFSELPSESNTAYADRGARRAASA